MQLSEEQQQLVTRNVAFAKWLASKIYHRLGLRDRVEWEDCLASAYLGLCVAATRYDSRRAKSFLTYASFWIRNKINESWVRGGVITVGWESGRRKGVYPRQVDSERIVKLDPIDDVKRVDDKLDTESLLVGLTERERQSVAWWCLDGDSLQTIGNRLGVTRSRAQQIVSGALIKIRQDVTEREQKRRV